MTIRVTLTGTRAGITGSFLGVPFVDGVAELEEVPGNRFRALEAFGATFEEVVVAEPVEDEAAPLTGEVELPDGTVTDTLPDAAAHGNSRGRGKGPKARTHEDGAEPPTDPEE